MEKQVKQSPRMTPASEAGQSPPTDANPTRQRYQLACDGDGMTSRQPTSARQFNRGAKPSRRGGY